jgi:chromosome segregation ATPase
MKTLLRAARQPLSVIVLVVAVFVGLTVHVLMLPLGFVVYLAAVVLAARDSSFARASQRARAYPSLTSRTFQALVNEIDRSQREIEDSVAQAKGSLAQVLQRIVVQTRELVDQAHTLALKGQDIEEYLMQMNYHQISSEIDRLDKRIDLTTDAYTRQQLEETRQALVNRQNNARALETFIGRITAQLHNIDANLDNVLAETVRLRTADTVSLNSSSNQVAERLGDLNADMSAFRQVLDTALVESGATTRL